MKKARHLIILLFVTTLIGASLAACGKGTNSGKDQQAAAPSNSESLTHPYKDYIGHQVEIPTSPKRVIFVGETFGDLLALKVNAVGGGFIEGFVFKDQVKDMVELTHPINLEKTLELNPDLIITANTDEKEYEQLVKIAPTIMFDTFAPLNERLTLLGDILGKQQQAKDWLAQYQAKNDAMWKQLHENVLNPGETASVFTYYPGDKLFVMARTGLSQVLYDSKGFKPVDTIQDILKENKGFEQISLEVLPKYAGDRIFILNPVGQEPQQSTANLLKSKIWLDLPAVKQGHVYFIDINKAGSDATTREYLLEQLPQMIQK